jgi:hypothetical protein
MKSTKNIIHTTGALLQPQKITDKSGNEIWVWVVSEFTDDSYKDGEVFNPKETAGNLEKLLIDTTEMES